VTDQAVQPSKGQRKLGVAVRFLRRMAFGIVAMACLLWLLARTEYTNYQRGIESSRATGLDAMVDRPFNAPMLMKSVAPQVKSAQAAAVPPGPPIARTESLNVSVRDFVGAQHLVDQIVKAHAGYVASMTISSPEGTSRSLSANIAIPTAQCDAAMDELKMLGRVEQERQGTEEVTSQAEDLDIRLRNAREAEARLSQILRIGTGKVSDVLEVEKEMARVREEIEHMESEQKHLNHRVAFASIDLNLAEEYQKRLSGSSSLGLQIRNALVTGFHAAEDGPLGVFVFFLSVGPSLLVWALILFWPGRWAWRRWRKSHASGLAGA
jgi:hypothetical protein